MTFAEKVKNLRISADLTQQQLGEQLGISPAAVGFLENGQRFPTGSTLVAYAKYFNISIDALMGLEPTLEDSIFSVKKWKGLELSVEEQGLLEDFRALSKIEKGQVREYAALLAEKHGN